jgi:hypothetical protein
MRVTCPYCKGEMEEPKGRELLIDEFKELYDQHRLACLFYRSLLTQNPIVRRLALTNLLFWYVQDHPAPEMTVPRYPANALMKIVASIIAKLRDPTEDRTTRPRMVKGQIVEVEQLETKEVRVVPPMIGVLITTQNFRKAFVVPFHVLPRWIWSRLNLDDKRDRRQGD